MLLNCGVGEDSWESLGLQEIQPVHFKGNQPWIFTGRTDAEAETLILWPPDVKNWHNGKDPDARKDWRQEEKGTTEDEMVEWHHWLDGYESEQSLGIDDGQGSLACCSLWGLKESGIIAWLNWSVYVNPKLLSIKSVMPSHPLPSFFPSIRVFSNESVLQIKWPKYWSFSFRISPSNEYSGRISFRMD